MRSEAGIGARRAANIIRNRLKELELPFTKVSGRTISFADLARCERVFVTAEGWQPNPVANEIKELAEANGFYVQFDGPGIVQGGW